MPLSWNEIRHNAIRFAKEARHYTSESADKQTFWNDFFGVFGLPRKTVASFEVPVLKTSGSFGKIDLLWKGVLLVEHKSAGEDLGKAKTQAFDYIQAMAAEGRRKELPRYVIVSDFANVVLHDLEEDTRVTFPLAQLHQHIHDFAFIPGYKQHKFEEQDPINIEATEMLGELHDALEFGGYAGHHLEQFLVRVLFCLFAEDTGLFQREAFRLYLENRTAEDGSDLGPRLAQLFGVLNTPVEQRQKNLDEELQAFPYVNGDLFSEQLGFAEFNRDMRNALLACTRFDWSRISPAIFGSLFQAVMEPKERRQIGGHYTSERDILKVIRSLFLDDLRAELDARKADRSTGRTKRLQDFHDRISALNFLDPACGCGNFLVITYRELRALETEVLLALYQSGDQELDVRNLARVDVHQFYGIEISEWPARIAEVALWLMDHQMNMRLSDAFGGWYPRLPLKKSPHIHCGNALRTDWQEVLPPAQCSYVLGNPPFIGSKFQNDEQRADMDAVAGEIENTGLLDYVTGWYFKAAEYIKGSRIVVGFVSTNSISQGEQVGVLWNPLFQQFGITIHFAHRTFAWQSEARGKAHVHVVIIGFANFETAKKQIYEYEGEKVSATTAKNISPYLIEGSNIAVTNRSQPICDVPEMGIGNKPIDDGNYLFTPEEKAEFLRVEPAAKKYFRRWFGSIEFINNIERWGLWLGECPPSELRAMPHAMARVEAVQKFRLASKSAPTRKIAATPTRYHVENCPKRAFLHCPRG
ncbi:MAG: DNA methyltransferase [Verrucomicrobiota bacterium]